VKILKLDSNNGLYQYTPYFMRLFIDIFRLLALHHLSLFQPEIQLINCLYHKFYIQYFNTILNLKISVYPYLFISICLSVYFCKYRVKIASIRHNKSLDPIPGFS